MLWLIGNDDLRLFVVDTTFEMLRMPRTCAIYSIFHFLCLNDTISFLFFFCTPKAVVKINSAKIYDNCNTLAVNTSFLCIILLGWSELSYFTCETNRWFVCITQCDTRWRNQMETFSALLALCAGKSPVTGEFPSQRPATRSFDVFFDLRLNKRLSNQSRRRWF